MSSKAGIQDFLMQVVAEFALAFDPLLEALQSKESIDEFLGLFGWELGAGATLNQVQAIFGNLPDVLKNLKPLTSKLLDALKKKQTPDLADFQQVVSLVRSIINLVNNIRNTSANLAPFNRTDFKKTFPDEVVESLVYRYVERRTPRLFGVLYLLGVFHEPEPDSSRPRPNYHPRRTNWHMVSTIFGDPRDVLKEAYDWGTTTFEQHQQHLMTALARLMTSFEIPVGLLPAGDAELSQYYDNTNPARGAVLKLNAPLVQKLVIDETARSLAICRLDLNVLPVPPRGSKGSPPAGLAVYPFLKGLLSQTAIPVTERVSISIKGGFESTGAIWIELYSSGAGVNSSLNAALDAEVRVIAERPTTDPWVLAGRRDSTHVWLSRSHLALQAKGPIHDAEAVIEAAADAAAFVLNFGEGDGFVNKIFGETPQVIDLATSLRWSSRHGLALSGPSGIALNVALHQSIGDVIHLDSLFIRLKAGEQTAVNQPPRPVLIQLAVSGKVTLGPVVATVDRVGVEASLTFPAGGGNLGPANLDLAFKPPDGAGLSIDANVLVGGGYLKFDKENQQYDGILYLEVKDKIALTAIGLLTTKVPGLPAGQKGFSLLIIITARFPPIQLGYGFALTGVGGLLGVNRTMVLDALRAGIKDHTVDSILFPRDPIKNAPKIISDLKTIFPPAQRRFVLGPMASIIWGGPYPLLTIELGILIELPSPIRLALLGRVTLSLPKREKADDPVVVLINMDIVGAVDFEKRDASIDATLFGSRITQFPLTGDMAMRLNWGASSTFAMAAGGFHPRFQPPPSFPALDRLALSIATGENPRLRLESYMAVTSNTIQFGARIDAYIAKGQFSGTAYLGFDALVEFPFRFVVDMYGGIVIKFKGTNILTAVLNLAFSGPKPWRAIGEARFDFLKFKRQIPIDWTSGEEATPELPPPSRPFEDLKAEIAKAHNWSAQLPDGGHMLVTLREVQAPDTVLAHPLGSLTFRQNTVPLDTPIERYGTTTPDTLGPFTIASITFGAGATASNQGSVEVRDPFAPAQFFNMSDEQKLASPAFQPLPSGRTGIGTTQIKAGPAISRENTRYETVFIDKLEERTYRDKKDGIPAYVMPTAVLLATAPLSAAGQSAMRSTGSATYAGPEHQQVQLKDPEYVVASVDDLSADTTAGRKRSEIEARLYLKDRGGRGYQVVGSHEAV